MDGEERGEPERRVEPPRDGGVGRELGARPVGGVVIGGAALVLFAFLLYSLSPLLNPFLLFLGLCVAMLPLRGTGRFWPVIACAGGLTLFWLLSELGFLLAPFVLALVVAYIFGPVVGWMARQQPLRRLDQENPHRPNGRAAAVLLLALPLVGALAAAAFWGLPYLAGQAQDVVERAPELLDRLTEYIASLEERLVQLPIPGIDGSEWVQRMRDLDAEAVVSFLQERGESLVQQLWGGAIGLGRGLATFFSVLGYLVLTPVIAFYLLRDYDRIRGETSSLIPPHKPEIRSFLKEYDELLSGFLRGQVTVALVIGSLTAAGLLITGFPYAILVGAVVAILGIIPYVGLILSLIPAVAIALSTGDPGLSLLKVAVVFGITQALEGTVVSPRILGDSTGLHPVWVLLAISLGGFFFGFVGLLIAVPLAVGVKLLAERGMRRYRRSAHFEEPARSAERP